MSTAEVLQAQERPRAGTGAARATRNEGMVPGIVYGAKKEPQMIAVDYKNLARSCQSLAFFSKVFALTINGKEQQVIAKDIQYHPVTDQPLHIDFQRVDKDSKINVFVPLVFANEEKSPALKRGGTLNVIIHSLEIVCPVHSIPEKMTVNLAGLDMGQSIQLSSLKLPAGAKAAHAERDNVLATIVAPSSAEEEPAA